MKGSYLLKWHYPGCARGGGGGGWGSTGELLKCCGTYYKLLYCISIDDFVLYGLQMGTFLWKCIAKCLLWNIRSIYEVIGFSRVIKSNLQRGLQQAPRESEKRIPSNSSRQFNYLVTRRQRNQRTNHAARTIFFPVCVHNVQPLLWRLACLPVFFILRSGDEKATHETWRLCVSLAQNSSPSMHTKIVISISL